MPDLTDAPYTIDESQIRQFREEGFIKLKAVFDAPTLERYVDEVTRLTFQIAAEQAGVPMEQRGTYAKAFLQAGNLWRHGETAQALSFSQRLAGIATDLLGVSGVRMYHDQSLYKEPAGGFTPWHVDQYYWPLDSGKTVTAWVPLQAVPLDMGPLEFGRGSHVKNIARDLDIGEDSERIIRDEIKKHGLLSVFEPYDLGEVSFHYGWTLHRAGPNTTDQPRKVHTVIYMDKDIRVAPPRHEHQKNDQRTWLGDAAVGTVPDGPLNPVLYERGN